MSSMNSGIANLMMAEINGNLNLRLNQIEQSLTVLDYHPRQTLSFNVTTMDRLFSVKLLDENGYLTNNYWCHGRFKPAGHSGLRYDAEATGYNYVDLREPSSYLAVLVQIKPTGEYRKAYVNGLFSPQFATSSQIVAYYNAELSQWNTQDHVVLNRMQRDGIFNDTPYTVVGGGTGDFEFEGDAGDISRLIASMPRRLRDSFNRTRMAGRSRIATELATTQYKFNAHHYLYNEIMTHARELGQR